MLVSVLIYVSSPIIICLLCQLLLSIGSLILFRRYFQTFSQVLLISRSKVRYDVSASVGLKVDKKMIGIQFISQLYVLFELEDRMVAYV